MAMYLVVFRDKDTPRKVLFTVVASTMSYGVFRFLDVAVILPLSLVGEYLLPSLHLKDVEYPLKWFQLFEIFYSQRRLIEMVFAVLLALTLVRKLHIRWPRISDAID
jgi:hypothetical protein